MTYSVIMISIIEHRPVDIPLAYKYIYQRCHRRHKNIKYSFKVFQIFNNNALRFILKNMGNIYFSGMFAAGIIELESLSIAITAAGNSALLLLVLSIVLIIHMYTNIKYKFDCETNRFSNESYP